MARIVCTRASFAFGDAAPLFSGVDFTLERGFVGLVGENGSGKSTLLRLLAGELRLESGQIERKPQSLRTHVCEQRVDGLPSNAGALAEASTGEAERLRQRLTLEPAELERWVTLSPGERKRWQIAGALFDEPDLLLLDEPSNHLDERGLAWLDGALGLFRGVGVLVTHDRALLDRHTHGTLRVHRGSVSSYALPYGAAQLVWQAEEQRARTVLGEMRGAERTLARQVHAARESNERRDAHSSLQKRMKGAHDTDASSMNRKISSEWASKRSTQGISALETRLEQARSRARPTVARDRGRALAFDFAVPKKARLLSLDEREVRAGERVVLRDVRLALERDARLGIRGDNGAGKTTLLACMLRALSLPRDRVLYLPQDIPEITARRQLEQVRGMSRQERGRVFELVAALGASPDALLASQSPSPGEARKLLLALGLSQQVEALFLDEPTNHLDLPSIERLEAALVRYPGALLAISHDARFLANTTNGTLLVAHGSVRRV